LRLRFYCSKDFAVTGTNNNPKAPDLEYIVGVTEYLIEAVKALGE